MRSSRPADVSRVAMTSALLVSAPFSGIEVHFRLLERVFRKASKLDRVEAIYLGHEPDVGMGRLPPFRWHWFTSAAWSTVHQLRELRRSGFVPDAALFNQANPALMLAPGSGLPPYVLQLDMTPRIMESMSVHYHGRPSRDRPVDRAKLGTYRQTFRAAQHLVAVSDLVRDSLLDVYGVPPSHVTVIPLTIDTEFFSCGDGLPPRDDALRLLFVGGEFERKGGRVLLEIATRADFADCEFHIVTASDVGRVPHNVFVHRDVRPNSERLRDLLAQSSIFVLPTLADLSSIASIEAMSMELPVVTTAVGGIPEIVDDGTTGYLVPPGDADALHERLLALVQSSDLRRRIGLAGRARALADHSADVNVPKYVDLLEAVA